MNSISNTDTQLTTPSESRAINALILDDDKFDRAKIRRLFKMADIPFVLSEADTLKALKSCLDTMQYDVVLIDYNLAYGTGLDALKLVQRHPKNANAATIMITGDDRSRVAVDAMKVGCKDYLSKSELTAKELRAAVHKAIQVSGIENSDDYRWQENVDNLTEVIVGNYATALQPKIANILQEAKTLRSQLGDPTINVDGRLESIEKQCMGLWLSLTDIKSLDFKS